MSSIEKEKVTKVSFKESQSFQIANIVLRTLNL